MHTIWQLNLSFPKKFDKNAGKLHYYGENQGWKVEIYEKNNAIQLQIWYNVIEQENITKGVVIALCTAIVTHRAIIWKGVF